MADLRKRTNFHSFSGYNILLSRSSTNNLGCLWQLNCIGAIEAKKKMLLHRKKISFCLIFKFYLNITLKMEKDTHPCDPPTWVGRVKVCRKVDGRIFQSLFVFFPERE